MLPYSKSHFVCLVASAALACLSFGCIEDEDQPDTDATTADAVEDTDSADARDTRVETDATTDDATIDEAIDSAIESAITSYRTETESTTP